VQARNELRGTCPEGDRLSIGHNDTVLPPKAVKPAKVPLFKVWRGAALAEIPGIPNRGHSSTQFERVKSKRGKILSMSEGSRRRLQAELAKIRTDVELYFTCLSAPGWTEHLTHATVKLAFIRLMKRLTAKAARDSRFRSLAGFWKQELQKRNMLHFHVLFSGVTLEDSAFVHAWVMGQWVECILDVPGMPPEIVLEEKRKMLAVHLHDSNWEKVRANFHAYFAKYLGKDVEAHAAEFPIPGRWWGKFNEVHIPWGKLCEVPAPDSVTKHAQRVARKVRQARADNARHRALCRKYDMLQDGQPMVSRFALLECYRRLQAVGGLDALLVSGGCGSPLSFALFVNGDSTPFRLLFAAHVAGERMESLLGGYKFPAAMKYSAVRLTGGHVPDMVVRILQYAGARALIDREQTPF